MCGVFNKAHYKQEWQHLRVFEMCVTDFVPNCPMLQTLTCFHKHSTKTQFPYQKIPFASCKHPVKLAGAHTVSPSLNLTHKFAPDSWPYVLCCLCPPGSQESDSSQTAKKDMLAALRARQEALEETLRQRLEELKSICIREAVREDFYNSGKYLEILSISLVLI